MTESNDETATNSPVHLLTNLRDRINEKFQKIEDAARNRQEEQNITLAKQTEQAFLAEMDSYRENRINFYNNLMEKLKTAVSSWV
jgi:hypothetical protein